MLFNCEVQEAEKIIVTEEERNFSCFNLGEKKKIKLINLANNQLNFASQIFYFFIFCNVLFPLIHRYVSKMDIWK